MASPPPSPLAGLPHPLARRAFVLALLVGLFLLSTLPSRPALAGEAGITVLAAASLTESLQAVAEQWSAKGHPKVTFSFDASSRLAKQVEAGAPVDAFLSADREWMDYLEGRGLIDRATRRDLLGNRLVAVQAVAGAPPVTSALDLSRPDIRHLALAGENVPAGKYARAALVQLGAWEAVEGRVVRGDNVRTVLGWVATGEAEAGVVYATDARVEPKVRVAFTFPAGSHPPIVYPMAVTRSSASAAEARNFLDFCKGEGMATFFAAGFTAPP